MPLLKRKPDLHDQYSRKPEALPDDFEKLSEDDFLADLDPASCDASDQEILDGLDFYFPDEPGA